MEDGRPLRSDEGRQYGRPMEVRGRRSEGRRRPGEMRFAVTSSISLGKDD